MADVPTPEAPESSGTPTIEPTTPVPGAPDGDSSAVPEINWEQRYNDLRPEADRRATLLADIEGRNGPERQSQALRQYANLEIEPDDPDPVDDEDFFNVPDPSSEIAQLKQELAEDKAQAEQARQNEAEAEYVEQTVAQLEKQDNLSLTDDEYNYVVNYGLTHRDEFDGRPDLEGGLAALKAVQQAGQQRYLKSKETAALAPTGSTGEPNINFRDKEARLKVAQEVFDAEMARQSQNQ